MTAAGETGPREHDLRCSGQGRQLPVWVLQSSSWLACSVGGCSLCSCSESSLSDRSKSSHMRKKHRPTPVHFCWTTCSIPAVRVPEDMPRISSRDLEGKKASLRDPAKKTRSKFPCERSCTSAASLHQEVVAGAACDRSSAGIAASRGPDDSRLPALPATTVQSPSRSLAP